MIWDLRGYTYFMKKPKNIRILVLGLLFCMIVWQTASASKKVPPPEQKDIIGVWIGFDNDRLQFCRLELNSAGKGFCSTAFVENPARLYAITNWFIFDFNISIDLIPIDDEAEPIYMKGLAGQDLLVLEIGGKGQKWKRELRLFNEKQFLSKNQRAKERIEKYKKEENNKRRK